MDISLLRRVSGKNKTDIEISDADVIATRDNLQGEKDSLNARITDIDADITALNTYITTNTLE